MSLLHQGRITVKPFAKVPPLAVANLPQILPAQGSISNVSSHHGAELEEGVNLAEGCLMTKTIKYTHRLTHLINAVGNEDPEGSDPIASIKFIGYL